MPGDSGVTCMLVCALPLPLHTRPRAHRAPGIPCALNSERAGNKSKPREKSIRRDREVVSCRHCEEPSCPPKPAFGRRRMRRSNPHFACCIRGAMDCFACARNDGVNREREVAHDKLPSLHAPLRVAGRGRGWGPIRRNAASEYAEAPPHFDPPHHFASRSGGRGASVGIASRADVFAIAAFPLRSKTLYGAASLCHRQM